MCCSFPYALAPTHCYKHDLPALALWSSPALAMHCGTYSSLLQVFSLAHLLPVTLHHRTLQLLPQHDVAFDYYGQRMATASSDRTVKVFDVSTEQQTLVAELRKYVREHQLYHACGVAHKPPNAPPGTPAHVALLPLPAMKALYGRWHGAIPSLAHFLRHAAMTAA